MTEEGAMIVRKRMLFAPSQTSFTADESDFRLQPRNGGLSLHQAVKNGSLSNVHMFLLNEEYYNINQLNARQGFTALHLASKYNRTEVVNLLLEFGAIVDIKGADGCTALHIASRFNAVDVIATLLKKGANPNAAKTFNKFTPLHEATSFGHRSAVECLLQDRKTHVNVEDTQGITPLHLACCHGYYDVCEVLLKCGASAVMRTTAGMTALHYAASNEDSKIVRLLLQSVLPPHIDSFARTSAINPEQRKAFVEYINIADCKQSTPLHNAIQAANSQAVELFLRHGAKVNEKKKNLQTSLHLAAFTENPNILKTLVANGADMNSKDELQRTPLHIAASFGSLKVLNVLIENGAKVDVTDNNGETAFLAAVSAGQIGCVGLLQEAGAKLDLRDMRMRSSIHLAISNERAEVLSFLLRNCGSDLVNSPDVEGRTPLHYAIYSTNEQILESLLQRKVVCCVKDVCHKTPLHLAAEVGRIKHVEALCRASISSIFEQDDSKKTPLHYAAMNNRRKACTLLIEMGADTMGRDSSGRSPLSLAALSGNIDVVQLLIDNHVTPDDVDIEGNTAMHLAALRGHVAIVQLLLDHGARVLLNDCGLTCLNVAMNNNNPEVVVAIIKHDRWQEVFLSNEPRQENPMRKLILNFPGATELVLDRCVRRSDPTSSERSITYDFCLLDPGPDGQIGPDGKRFYGLETMVEGKRQELLQHMLSRKLLNVKWRTYGWYLYWVNFIIYTTFILLLTVFMITERKQIQLHKPNVHPTTDESLYKGTSSFSTVIAHVTFVFAVVNLLKEVYQIISQGLQYFIHPSNLLEWALYSTAIVFVIPQINFFEMKELQRKPHIYWQMGTWCISLGYMNVILFSRTISYVGLYVTMFLEVGKTMLKASGLFFVFLLGFSVVFYILFKEQDAFDSIGKVIVKVTVMLVGEIDYNTMLVQNLDRTNSNTDVHMVPYKGTSFVLFYIFLWCMPIILMNLLVGLAVGDIEAIQKNAFLRNKARKISFLVEIESKFPKFITRRLHKPKLVVKPSSIFKRKTMELLDDDFEVEAIHDQHEQHYQALTKEIGKMKGRIKEVMTALKDIQKTVGTVASTIGLEESLDERL